MRRAADSEDPVLRRALRCGLSASVPFDIFPLFRIVPISFPVEHLFV